MSMLLFAPAVLGAFTVLQAGLNRKIASAWGLPAATLLNSLVLVAIAAAVFGYAHFKGTAVPQLLRVHPQLAQTQWWYIIPGLIGFVLVFGGPWAVAKWGAVHTFIFLISGQLIMSLLWDLFVEKVPVTRERVIGILIAWAGAVFATWKKSGS